jgi:thiamine biosynthesis lipoprotein
VTVQLVVTGPVAIEPARAILADELAALDLACSRFRGDSEVVALRNAGGRPMAASELLCDAVAVALVAAADTDGTVDPTLGAVLESLGYDRDHAALDPDATEPATPADPPVAAVARVSVRRRATWRDVHVGDGTVTVPAGVLLDLGATAKAFGADRAASRVATDLGCGVLVSLGGDVAVAGQAPVGGWPVRVQDLPGALEDRPLGPHQTVAIGSGGLATSSTRARRWRHGGQMLHHILNPTTMVPAVSPWRTISAVAGTCVGANTLTTAGIIRGESALSWLRGRGVPARLVTHAGEVFTVCGWPDPPTVPTASASTPDHASQSSGDRR